MKSGNGTKKTSSELNDDLRPHYDFDFKTAAKRSKSAAAEISRSSMRLLKGRRGRKFPYGVMIRSTLR